MADPDNRDYFTSVACINGTGQVIPPMIILPRKGFFDKWADNEFDGDTLLRVNYSKYSNDDLALKWFQQFDRCTRNLQLNKWKLLIFGFYLIYEFFDYAVKANICLWRFIFHSTHCIQF